MLARRVALGGGGGAAAPVRRAAQARPEREQRTQHVEGVVWSDIGWNLRRGRSAASPKVAHLNHGSKVFVVDRHSGPGNDWAKVTTPRGQEGYLPSNIIRTDLPCPGARIHRVRPGQTALGIAGIFFGKDQVDGLDGRFYVNVLQFVNNKTTTDSWKDVRFDANRSIWIPSVEFAKSLKGTVKTGSITGGAWAKAKRAVGKVASLAADITVGAAAFVYGALRGVGIEVKELVVGVAGLPKQIVNLVKSILSGSILNDIKDLWSAVSHLPLKRLLGDLWRDFEGKKKGYWDRWVDRGEYIGRAVALAVMTFFSGGAALVVSRAGKLGKLVSALKRLSIVQRAKRVSGKTRKKAGELFTQARVFARLGPKTRRRMRQLSPAQVVDYYKAFGPKRVQHLARTYGGPAMKEYGVAFFKSYKGVTSTTRQHLLTNDGIVGKELKGCHDTQMFMDELVKQGRGEVVGTPRTHPRNTGIVAYEYKLYKRNADGTIKQPKELKGGSPAKKTTIDHLRRDFDTWAKKAEGAADKSIRDVQLAGGGQGRFEQTVDGVTIAGYIRNGEIDTFFPEF